MSITLMSHVEFKKRPCRRVTNLGVKSHRFEGKGCWVKGNVKPRRIRCQTCHPITWCESLLSVSSSGPTHSSLRVAHLAYSLYPSGIIPSASDGTKSQIILILVLDTRVKRGFHETTKINQTDHRCMQIDRWVLETSRHRPMDTGAILAAD